MDEVGSIVHAQNMKGYAQEEYEEPRQPAMVMQTVNEDNGESDGDNGSGGKNGYAQNGETKSTQREKRRVL